MKVNKTVADLEPHHIFKLSDRRKNYFMVKKIIPVPTTAPEYDHGKMIVIVVDEKERCRQLLLWPSSEVVTLETHHR